MAKIKYVCNWHVSHDGRRHEPGAEIEVSGRAAEMLLDCGAIRHPGAAAPSGAAKPTGRALIDAIREAIGGLDRSEGSEDFTQDGKPVVAALERVLGYDIAAGDRDAAWEEYLADNPDLLGDAGGA